VVPLAFAFGGVAQIFAGWMEFKNNATFGTVAFSAYGLFWWWWAFLQWMVGAGWVTAPSATGVGFILAMWGVFTLYMWVSTFRSNRALWTVFLLLWITFFLLAGGDFGFGTGRLGGWTGLLCGIVAMYTSFAEVTKRDVRAGGAAAGGADPQVEVSGVRCRVSGVSGKVPGVGNGGAA